VELRKTVFQIRVKKSDIQIQLNSEEGIISYDLAVWFLNRHPSLPVRKAEAMLCGRAVCLDQGQMDIYIRCCL
jgi:hypothetical protein